MEQFSGRVAVVTGAASGIGRALAERFAVEGMKIVLADVEANPLKQAESEMRAAGHEVFAVRTDVSKARSVATLARKTLERYGAVHILCNNAGVVPPQRYAPVWEFTLEDWKWALDVNLWGVVHGIQSFLPLMLERGEEGHIVNTASVSGLISGSEAGVYGVTKHGVVRLTEAIYASLRERGEKIGVSVLCPGVVSTGIYNSERNRPGSRRSEGDKAPTAYHEIAKNLYRTAMTPQQVAEQVVGAIRDRQLYVITTRAFDGAIRERMESILERRNPEFPDLLALSKLDSCVT
ncbi:SDR family NAD(P)-dependent oxidoreductase [Paraburkholderia sp. BL10I2N1]|uniref:SDR family NAD(P)-dependent oxidoreductase n=1 Tax=Paraburkholderia sp. BL10I2N1 TaxID=1938796 RepID=UPI00105B29FE|nr:SDR family NAD(P)-dependent oxidoreductase [Paraburkholderia sp. BL10I2N1]TDN61965.1 NADP-dependent 3-hydroxy acid dehydrogenase YdfG [Paraburkholderia sp. BL10I2N1]